MTDWRRSRSTLTLLADLIGHRVTWRPKAPSGTRNGPVSGVVQSFDATAKTLTIPVPQSVTMWQPHPHRDVTVSCPQGPFHPEK